MRSLISSWFLIITFTSFSQRVTFDDPDLSFSFKKPKNWQIVDDGYVIKIAPTFADTATTYLSLTYFEDPAPLNELSSEGMAVHLPEYQLQEIPFGEEVNLGTYLTRMTSTRLLTDDDVSLIQKMYRFKDHGQQWEIITSYKASERKMNHTFEKVIKSLKIVN